MAKLNRLSLTRLELVDNEVSVQYWPEGSNWLKYPSHRTVLLFGQRINELINFRDVVQALSAESFQKAPLNMQSIEGKWGPNPTCWKMMTVKSESSAWKGAKFTPLKKILPESCCQRPDLAGPSRYVTWSGTCRNLISGDDHPCVRCKVQLELPVAKPTDSNSQEGTNWKGIRGSSVHERTGLKWPTKKLETPKTEEIGPPGVNKRTKTEMCVKRLTGEAGWPKLWLTSW